MGSGVKSFQIDSGTKVSNAVELLGYEYVFGLEIPILTSCDLYIQAATKEDGDYRRILLPDGSGDWKVSTTTGDKVVFLDLAAPFSFIKVESSVNQAADREFNLVFKE